MGDENVPQQPLEAFLSGEFAQLPIIIGTNEDEGVAFMFGKMSTAQALAALKMYFGALLLDGHYWTSFARDGSPDNAADPQWPQFDSAGEAVLSLQTPAPAPLSYVGDATCAMWDAVGYDH